MSKDEKIEETEVEMENNEKEEISTEEKTDEKIQDETEEDVEETEEESDESEEKTSEDIIEEQKETINQQTETIQRLRADFDNFKKRSDKEKADFVKYANEGVILEVLEAYEDLERALEVKEDKDLREGVELIYKKMSKILKDQGVEEIETEHQKFDPFKHEALMTQASDDYENNEIIQAIQKGYTLNSKVIKYSKVIVCKK